MLELSPRIRVAIGTYADTDDGVDDLLQECWVQILERLDRYEPRGSFAGWAIAVSRNVCRTKLRAKQLTGSVENELPNAIQSRADTEGGSQDGRETRHRFWRRVVNDALAQLPDRERDVIVMRLLQGKTTADTAAVLRVTEEAVRAILKRGLSRLKRMEELRGLLPEWKGWT